MDSVIGNTSCLRELNFDRVRETLKLLGPASRQTLAQATGLSVATCGNLLRELLASGEVVELSPAPANGGRPARRFAYNFSYSLLALLHIGKEAEIRTLTVAVADAGGRIIDRRATIFPQISLEVVCAAVEEVLAAHPSVKAVAISYPGVVLDGRIDCWGDLEELFDCDLKGELEGRFPVKAVLENDMNLAAVGYCRRGDAGERGGGESVSYLSFFHDILPGCGTVVDGKLIRGRNGFAGEVTTLPLGWNKVQQLEHLRTFAGRVRQISHTVVTVVAMLNPETVVLCGGMFGDASLRAAILAACREGVPEKFLPAVVFRENWLEDMQSGLLACGLELLRCPVQLIARNQNRL